MLNNVAKKYVGDKEVDAVRGAYENRARWYYYLVREGLDKGLPLEFALEELTKSSGQQLDPTLTPTFVRLIRSRSIPLSPQAAVRRD